MVVAGVTADEGVEEDEDVGPGEVFAPVAGVAPQHPHHPVPLHTDTITDTSPLLLETVGDSAHFCNVQKRAQLHGHAAGPRVSAFNIVTKRPCPFESRPVVGSGEYGTSS